MMTLTRRKLTKGSFAGSVLLSKAEWDKEQLIRDLREEWGIVDEEPDDGDEDDENSDDAVCNADRQHDADCDTLPRPYPRQ